MSSIELEKENHLQHAIIRLVNIMASKSTGSWEVEKVPELASLRVSYSRKLKSPPFTTYRIDQMIQGIYDMPSIRQIYNATIEYNNTRELEAQHTLEEMKKRLDSEILNQLTE